MRKSNNIVGKIHSIDTYSTLDGFGIRSVVFMQGCRLRCIYCHNPDTWIMDNGQQSTVADIVNKLRNYSKYYGKDGGVTFGGGEPLLQAEFVGACVDEFSKLNVKCAIETSGNVELTSVVKKVLNKLDFVICDLKFATEQEYEKYTCSKLSRTLEFLKYLEDNNVPVWIRTVVVPDINDNIETLRQYQEIVTSYKNVIKWELLPLSKLGFGKYEKLNITNRLLNVRDLDMDKFKNLQEMFEINTVSK